MNILYSYLSKPTFERGVKKAIIDGPKRLSPREKTSGVATNVYLRETLENQKRSANFENEGSGVVYT